jgi:hypothetical protein
MAVLDAGKSNDRLSRRFDSPLAARSDSSADMVYP